jgi:hypothetical protein
MRDSIIEQSQNAACLERCDLNCSAGDNFRQLLVSWHNLSVPAISEVDQRITEILASSSGRESLVARKDTILVTTRQYMN